MITERGTSITHRFPPDWIRRMDMAQRSILKAIESRDSVLMEFVSEYSPFGAVSAAQTARSAEERAVEDLLLFCPPPYLR